MTVTYRSAAPTDLTAVDVLFRASFAATFGHLYRPADYAVFMDQFTSASWAAELAQDGCAIRLAEEAGVAIGYAKIGALRLPVAPVGPAIELRQLYLTEAAKGRGVADALLEWVVHEARTRGAGEVFLSVWAGNDRAKRFYVRHGFVDVGPYAFMVGEQADEDRLMRLAL